MTTEPAGGDYGRETTRGFRVGCLSLFLAIAGLGAFVGLRNATEFVVIAWLFLLLLLFVTSIALAITGLQWSRKQSQSAKVALWIWGLFLLGIALWFLRHWVWSTFIYCH